MKHTLKKLSIILIVSLYTSCSKDKLCNNFPCDTNRITVKDFSDIKYRKGKWVNITNIKKRSSTIDTIQFETDSTWSYWAYDSFSKTTSGFYLKKYELHQPFANTGNTGSIKNFANFLNQSTTDYRTYDWYYDTARSFVYIDFNRDFRSLTEPVVYSRFIKIE